MKEFKESVPERFNYKLNYAGFHGDVLIKCEMVPEKFEQLKKAKDPVLAYGEFSGHSHALERGVFDLREDVGCLWLKVIETTLLKHQEHDQVLLPPGDYRVDRQKEYDYILEETRKVAD